MKIMTADLPPPAVKSYDVVAETARANVFLMANDLGMGGTQKHLAILAEALNQETFRVEFGCLQRRGCLAQSLSREWDITEFPLGGSFLSRQALSSARSLSRYLRAREVRIAQAFSFYSNILMIPAARMAGVPVVIGSQRQLGDLLTSLQFSAQAVVFQLCDAIVCNSQAAAERLKPWGLARKLVVIRNAVSEDIFRVGELRRRARTPGIARVGMISRMSASKNHALLIRAAARLSDTHPGIKFFLVGDGPERFQLENMTREMGLTGHINFLRERLDLGNVLADLDISVLTTSSESCPNALTESMAAGLPTLATRVGGISELICHGKTGLLVAPDDDVRLAQEIAYLADNPDVSEQLARNGRQFALQHFRLEQARDAYMQLYAELLDRKKLSSDVRAASRPADRG
jgi:glycosyltransferase involved in cell wall biosynthesis